MIDDLRSHPDGALLDCDVCIVGAGPAGIALALSLARAPLRILVLESGGFEVESEAQSLNEAEVTGLSMSGHLAGRVRAFGGAARLWAGQCLPLDPIDFEPRGWVPHSGWPIGPADLADGYRQAEAFFEVEGEGYGEETYRRFGLAVPAWDADALRTMFTVYTPKVDTARFSARAIRSAGNICLLTHAHAAAIETDATGVARSVDLRSALGKSARIEARAIVLCGGGLENPRILLNSTGRRPRGLGNEHDLVGRFFQEHPNAVTATLAGDGTALQEQFRLLYRRERRYFPKLALGRSVQEAKQVLNANAHLVFEYPEDSCTAALERMFRSLRAGRPPERPWRDLGRVAADLPALASVMLRRLRGRSPKARPAAVKLQCYLEQAPNPQSRVMLSERRDQLGLRQMRLDWRLTELERRTLVVLTATVQREFRRLGLGELEAEGWLAEPGAAWEKRLVDSYHHGGTTRMAATPSEGVVDRNCEVFGVLGLYVCGNSVFPTSGYANPTLTIVALAMRLASHLRTALGCRPLSRAA
ncbi:MAG TPA: GMC family oxidoreductase [Geminicoccaceae bacterium]|nr:GMC family oxidoreductase [Geminicoccus sp.]HMU51150.1 GMC family oxidoreductase [Geminicoccaceae bacterium]